MRAILIVTGLVVLGVAAHTSGGVVTTERPVELALVAVVIVALAIVATPSEQRLRNRQGKEVPDENADPHLNSPVGQVFDWSRLADHQPDRSDQVRRTG